MFYLLLGTLDLVQLGIEIQVALGSLNIEPVEDGPILLQAVEVSVNSPLLCIISNKILFYKKTLQLPYQYDII